MIKKRTICVLSSSRADYNHLYLLMKSLKESQIFDFKLLVTGMHLLKKYGDTYSELVKDGFKIDGFIKNSSLNNNHNQILNLMSDQLSNAGKQLDKINPDILVILGDRYDVLPIAIASHIKGIAIAHFHGGEVTHGAIDDAIRHAITKFSDIHFVSNKEFKKRVQQLGENTKNVHNIGSLGVQAIKLTPIISKQEIQEHFDIHGDYILIAIHPETINADNIRMIKSLFDVLSKDISHQIIFTSPNSDPGNEIIIKNIKSFLKDHPKKAKFIVSAGRELFIYLMRHCNFIIGNSSSCVIEAPALGIKSILIGDRQSGRPISSSVSQSSFSRKSISSQIKITENLRKTSAKKIHYKGSNTIPKILKILETVPLKEIKLKKFKDI